MSDSDDNVENERYNIIEKIIVNRCSFKDIDMFIIESFSCCRQHFENKKRNSCQKWSDLIEKINKMETELQFASIKDKIIFLFHIINSNDVIKRTIIEHKHENMKTMYEHFFKRLDEICKDQIKYDTSYLDFIEKIKNVYNEESKKK